MLWVEKTTSIGVQPLVDNRSLPCWHTWEFFAQLAICFPGWAANWIQVRKEISRSNFGSPVLRKSRGKASASRLKPICLLRSTHAGCRELSAKLLADVREVWRSDLLVPKFHIPWPLALRKALQVVLRGWKQVSIRCSDILARWLRCCLFAFNYHDQQTAWNRG